MGDFSNMFSRIYNLRRSRCTSKTQFWHDLGTTCAKEARGHGFLASTGLNSCWLVRSGRLKVQRQKPLTSRPSLTKRELSVTVCDSMWQSWNWTEGHSNWAQENPKAKRMRSDQSDESDALRLCSIAFLHGFWLVLIALPVLFEVQSDISFR